MSGETAIEIAKRYPVTSAFVQVVIDDLGGDIDLVCRWLDAQAATGIYYAPSHVRGALNLTTAELSCKVSSSEYPRTD